MESSIAQAIAEFRTMNSQFLIMSSGAVMWWLQAQNLLLSAFLLGHGEHFKPMPPWFVACDFGIRPWCVRWWSVTLWKPLRRCELQCINAMVHCIDLGSRQVWDMSFCAFVLCCCKEYKEVFIFLHFVITLIDYCVLATDDGSMLLLTHFYNWPRNRMSIYTTTEVRLLSQNPVGSGGLCCGFLCMQISRFVSKISSRLTFLYVYLKGVHICALRATR